MWYLVLAQAHAASPVAIEPTGWVRPGFNWLQDSDAIPTDQDGFVLAARIGAEARYATLVTARLELDLAPEPSLKDAVATVRPAPWLQVGAGQFKVPVSIHQLTSDTRRLLPGDPLVSADLPTRDIGAAATLMLPGARPLVAITTSAFNGEGANRLQNVNQSFLLAQRLVVTPFGVRAPVAEGTDGQLYLGIGGGWVYDKTGDASTLTETNDYAGDVQFAWRMLSAQGELAAGQRVYANPDLDNTGFWGGYGQVASFLPTHWGLRHLEVVARGGISEPDTVHEGAAGGQIRPRTVEITGGLNLYARLDGVPLHDLKLQAAYTHYAELEGDDVPDDGVSIVGTARF